MSASGMEESDFGVGLTCLHTLGLTLSWSTSSDVASLLHCLICKSVNEDSYIPGFPWERSQFLGRLGEGKLLLLPLSPWLDDY